MMDEYQIPKMENSIEESHERKSHWVLFLILAPLAFMPLQGSEKTPIPDSGNEKVAMVASIKELQEAVAGAAAGSTVLLKNGQYDRPCVLKGKGSKGRPIVIRAETIGGVELLNQVAIQGEHLFLIGFRFTDNGAIAVKSGVACRISRCHMNNLKAAQWLRVDSKSRGIEIDHCLFEKKENNRVMEKGCQLLRVDQTNTNESHHIHHNHFRDIPKGKNGNGYETIQLISVGNPKDPEGGGTGNLIEFNLFERCGGESEIISVKSNGNLLRGNTFSHCRGELVLRHGHRNVVNGNWFLGGNGGVRLQGKDQVVVNNYFDRLTGSGLAMMDGTVDELYVRVERALVAHNTFANCGHTFHIGLNHSAHPDGTVPRACIIANNVFYQEKDAKNGLITFVKNQEPEEWTWQGNIYQGVIGIAPRRGLQQSSAFTRRNGELLLPTAQTPAALRTGLEPTELAVDLAGKARQENATVGAFQYDTRQSGAKPLGAEDVGLLAGMEGEK
jgi:poly(beta-D-mannuronate) lyase